MEFFWEKQKDYWQPVCSFEKPCLWVTQGSAYLKNCKPNAAWHFWPKIKILKYCREIRKTLTIMFVEIDYLLIVECRSSSLFKQLCPSVDREFYGMPKLKGYVQYKAKTLLKSLGISEFLQCSFFTSRKRRPSLADLQIDLSMGDYRITLTYKLWFFPKRSAQNTVFLYITFFAESNHNIKQAVAFFIILRKPLFGAVERFHSTALWVALLCESFLSL